jgi:hypothetical protein
MEKTLDLTTSPPVQGYGRELMKMAVLATAQSRELGGKVNACVRGAAHSPCALNPFASTCCVAGQNHAELMLYQLRNMWLLRYCIAKRTVS